MNRESLNEKLIQAHEENNIADLLVLYTRAGDDSEKAGDIDAACFYLTHAYVFALDAGSEQANVLLMLLLQYGRVQDLNG
jgi:hypothetical protein